jgi:C2 domain
VGVSAKYNTIQHDEQRDDPTATPVLQLTVCDLTDRAIFMTRYQLSLEAENLARRFCGSLRNPNPYVVVKVCGGPKEGTVVGRTEPIRRTLQPDWVECLFLDTGEPRCVNMNMNSPHYVSLCGRLATKRRRRAISCWRCVGTCEVDESY